MIDTVIIGAGLTGISTAYHLEKNGYTDYLLFEKESESGGLCRSIQQDGFTFDYTGHLLHTSDPYFRSLLNTMYGLENCNNITRRSYIYSQDTYTKYPYQINLAGLPHQTIIDCITQYVNRPHISDPQTFRHWVLTNFGQGLADHFFFPYQEKIFATSVDDLTATWTQRFVPSTSLEQILQGSLEQNDGTQHTEPVGYNSHFYYPKQGGIHAWVKAFAGAVEKPMHTGYGVSAIDITNKVIYFENGHEQSYKTLVSTMPLDYLLDCIVEPAGSNLAQAKQNLKCNQVINFNIGCNKHISDKHWIYYPEKQYPFYRIGFHSNFSSHMAPEGHSLLYGEIAHRNQSSSWIASATEDAIAQTKQLFNITNDDIVIEKTINIDHAYVIYDAWRDANLPNLLHTLAEYGIHSIGRYGAWKYASMQEAVLDGRDMAEQLSMHTMPLSPVSHHEKRKQL